MKRTGHHMKHLILISLLFFIGGCFKNSPTSEDEKKIYAIGYSLGENLQNLNLSEKERKILAQGLIDRLAGSQAQVDVGVYGNRLHELHSSRQKDNITGEKS